jgi:hypothetical protein
MIMAKCRKEKSLNFRCKKYLYDFLVDFVKDKPYDRSDVLNKLVENFYLEFQKGNDAKKIMEMEFIFVPFEKNTLVFLSKFAEDCDCNVRQMVLNIVHYFFMGYLSGEFTKPMSELRSKMEQGVKDLNPGNNIK